MAATNRTSVPLLILTVLGTLTVAVLSQYSVLYENPVDCKETNGYAYFFNASQLRCVPCTQNSTVQKTSSDGLSCDCRDGYFLTYNYGGWIICAACPFGQVTAFNRWECVDCSNVSAGTGTSCLQCVAQNNQITVQRQLNGSYGTQNPSQTCESCASYTMPNREGRQCLRCNQILSMVNSSDCYCETANQAGGLCFQTSADISLTSEIVRYSESVTVTSAYFSENAVASVSMCNSKYGNTTACELLANLCALSGYDETGGTVPTTCTQFRRLAGSLQWPPNMPWLYYLDRSEKVLTDTGIPTRFTFPNGELRFRAGSYSLNGTFLGFADVKNGLLQLCKNSEDYMNAAYVFGTSYSQKCDIPVQSFWDESRYPSVLYDLWIEYDSSIGTMIYGIPIAFGEELLDIKVSHQLYRRFLLVDNVIGKEVSGGSIPGRASVVRYAKDMTIVIRLQDKQDQGLIYPPYVLIKYGHATLDDYNTNRIAKMTFQVRYFMSTSQYETGTSIAVGVLAGLSLLYAGLKTWSWSRRSGRATVDFMTLIKYLMFACGYVADSLFVVAFGSSVFWWILYKNQGTVVMVMPSTLGSIIVVYLAIGFALKLVDLFHVIMVQSNVNLFLIDWERPTAQHAPSADGTKKQKQERDTPVSIWRTYFVANEWNELQTLRKINPMFQIVATVFFLDVVGFGNLATEDPHSDFSLTDPNGYHSSPNSVFRFGIFGMVYLLIALAQWLFFALIYDRFFEDKMTEYIDFCSMNNISVFILENDYFGYYIHGRSVHGRADVGLREMHENFARESRDLCSKRGLLPESDQQTFQMALPKKLKSRYDRILLPVLAAQFQGGSAVAGTNLHTGGGIQGDSSVPLDLSVAMTIDAYGTLNHLLRNFLDHTLKGVDYSVVNKSFVEQILDMEFKDPSEFGYFYRDNGHSFDRLFFYGNELMLLVFEMLFFGLVDHGTKDFLFTGAMLYILMEIIIKKFRDSIGKSNLAKKTLVDKRFLI